MADDFAGEMKLRPRHDDDADSEDADAGDATDAAVAAAAALISAFALRLGSRLLTREEKEITRSRRF